MRTKKREAVCKWQGYLQSEMGVRRALCSFSTEWIRHKTNGTSFSQARALLLCVYTHTQERSLEGASVLAFPAYDKKLCMMSRYMTRRTCETSRAKAIRHGNRKDDECRERNSLGARRRALSESETRRRAALNSLYHSQRSRVSPNSIAASIRIHLSRLWISLHTLHAGGISIYIRAGQKISGIRSRSKHNLLSSSSPYVSRRRPGGVLCCSLDAARAEGYGEKRCVCVLCRNFLFLAAGRVPALRRERVCGREKRPRLRILLIPAHISPEVNKSKAGRWNI
jgi:hypothetical protein